MHPHSRFRIAVRPEETPGEGEVFQSQRRRASGEAAPGPPEVQRERRALPWAGRSPPMPGQKEGVRPALEQGRSRAGKQA